MGKKAVAVKRVNYYHEGLVFLKVVFSIFLAFILFPFYFLGRLYCFFIPDEVDRKKIEKRWD